MKINKPDSQIYFYEKIKFLSTEKYGFDTGSGIDTMPLVKC